MSPSFRLYKAVIWLLLCCSHFKSVGQTDSIPVAPFPSVYNAENDRIIRFHSDIRVKKDGNIEVSELIIVNNDQGGDNNDQIQRGIVRDFPTRYQDSRGFWSNTGFKLKAVYKNGRPENYLQESLGNGGNKDILLDKGVYQYRIDYITNNQLIFHKNKDELYWNVNGNGWSFTADTISCTITFPEGSEIVEYACYSGSFGETAKNCSGVMLDHNRIMFSGTKKFDAYEGLTVAASIQKGILLAPGKGDKLINFLGSNYIIPTLALLLIILVVFYVLTWLKKGRDPIMGTIYPQFEPPVGLSAADTGYIIRQEFGTHLFAAAIVDAAVHKELEIEVAKKGMLIKTTTYQFNKKEGAENLDAEKSIERYGFNMAKIFGETAERGTYNSKLKSLQTELENKLKDRFNVSRGKKGGKPGLFALNRGYGAIGFVILVISLVTAFLFIINHFTQTLLIFSAGILLAMLIIQIIFSRIMSAYTEEGRDIADHILGFKMYLEQAEQRMYQQLTPPEKTLDLFEKYLPYAIALKVENAWAEKFDHIIQQAIATGYQPAYFQTNSSFGRSFNMSDMSRGISSGLSSTISSSSTPPSSSRGGSSGGGSSGGGGGGGGGGGW
jgi:uncharacterized membrane protein YgcG